MSTPWRYGTRSALRAAGLSAGLLLAAVPQPLRAAGPAAAQATFASPEQAVDRLVTAVRANETADLMTILGPDGRDLVYSGDPVADELGRKEFVSAYEMKNLLELRNDSTAILMIGRDDWPLPIPIVRSGAGWRFDTQAGEDEILNRTIGRNELAAIQSCRAFVDAEREYASADRNGDGLFEYAQQFVSSPGKRDGLYWPAEPGEPESPVGLLMADARAEGYGAGGPPGTYAPYHGYFYRILQAQGKNAVGGARDYVVDGHMIGGFALVAFPAKYGVSGVMTFIVNQDGTVFQKDLGPRTTRIAMSMQRFDPDSSWAMP